MTKFIIVANGEFLVKEILDEAIEGKTIVALDGAANKLARLGITPDIILGDFDSTKETEDNYWGIKGTFNQIDNESKPYTGNYGVTIVPAKDQDKTDLEKAIEYCDRQGAKQIEIVCATGGRMDHHEFIMRVLLKYKKSERIIFLHTEQQTLMCGQDETVAMTGEIGDKCGVMAFPEGEYKSKGLAWNECKLTFGKSESVCNELTEKNASIKISGSVLMIMPPTFPSQRKFMSLSKKDRLKLQLRDEEQNVFVAKSKQKSKHFSGRHVFWAIASTAVCLTAKILSASTNQGTSKAPKKGP